jgi:hypothetical protein
MILKCKALTYGSGIVKFVPICPPKLTSFPFKLVSDVAFETVKFVPIGYTPELIEIVVVGTKVDSPSMFAEFIVEEE